ncbi:ABC transporter permease [Prosthecomicrobium pneumaticum]|uniref:Simple sugar transport system permease protein n=1 Tax=Prosthecomicrobium pneumaticum TaxID=81895 RepID=A0A7W9L300_9HYPH|nr:ABC transporter permease [Prosthecomicrobium pneumaticum]MBB5753999.1 simple sugar transport system permease protein [Prosthecomicrobium pneumaticum]
MTTRDTAGGIAAASAGRPAFLSAAALRLRDLALLPALAVLVVVGTFVSPAFLTQANIYTILTSSAALALVVLAESLIIITGKFDLSLESIAGFAPAIGAMLVIPAATNGFGTELPTYVGILAILAIGGLVGLVNGFLVVHLKLNAFIVTLAMLIILRGMLVGATNGRTLFDMPDAFYALMIVTVLGLPLAVWLAALAFAVAGVMLRYHRLGRALYAIGGNAEAARAAGIRVERVVWGVYVIAGMLAAVGGLAITGYVGAVSANQGNGMIFTVFAAAVIGGISLEGGRGTMFGALTGVLLLGLVQNLLTLAQVPSFWIQAIYGAIILGALMVARVTSGRAQT